MTANSGFVYRGPREFVVTDRSQASVRLLFHSTTPVPEGTEIWGAIGNFRSFSEGQWHLDGTEMVAGDGDVEVLDEIRNRDEFDEFDPYWDWMQRSKLRPHRIRLCRCRVTETLEPADASAARYEPGVAVAIDVSGETPLTAGLETQFEVWTLSPDADDPERVGQPVAVPNLAGPPAHLEVRPNAFADDDGCVDVTVSATDSWRNATDYAGSVTLSAGGDATGLPDEVSFDPEDDGHVTVRGIEIDGSGPVRFEAADPTRQLSIQSPAVFGEPLSGWRHYFGAIHFHSLHSGDGDRTVEQAYHHARDHLNLDVVAVTDHTPDEAAWAATLEENAQFDDSGEFVTLPAWEWSTGDGHADVFLRTPDVDAGPDRARSGEPTHPGDTSWPDDAIVVPHHTNTMGPYDWSRRNDRIRLVEITQKRGSFETDNPDPEWGALSGGDGASVRDALAAGYRVGFTAGTDNHQGYPTVSSPVGFGFGGWNYAGLTGFLAPELTREAIWRAMDARRTYATTGAPIVCHFAVNGHVLGSKARFLDGDDVVFDARLHGTAPIERVEVVSDGRTVWTADPDERDVALDSEALPVPDGDGAYYYLRLRQSDGNRAWASPVWLDRDA